MDSPLRRAVEAALTPDPGRPVILEEIIPVGGGSINQTYRLTLRSGERCFLKTHPNPPPRFSQEEARGLAALAEVGILRVPRVLHTSPDPPAQNTTQKRLAPFLVLEAIPTGRPQRDTSERFGRRLAQFHRQAQGQRFGFPQDNYLGLTPQPNGWCQDWADFWRKRRLGHQLELARQAGLSDPTLNRLGDRLLDRLEEWLAEPAESPCLIHGDLWGGNYLIDTSGDPVLIDPAVYFGRREAELAMTRLFGGFDARFYAAYEEAWPLAPGSSERLAIYELYHLLNHLNLFGRGYRDRCLAILRRLL
jgi:fructosamine-3-kinase